MGSYIASEAFGAMIIPLLYTVACILDFYHFCIMHADITPPAGLGNRFSSAGGFQVIQSYVFLADILEKYAAVSERKQRHNPPQVIYCSLMKKTSVGLDFCVRINNNNNNKKSGML